jgi:hypothetical protein
MAAYIIDEDIVVPLGEGELRFANPGEAAWVEIEKARNDESLSFTEKGKRLFQELVEVKNLKTKNGDDVTVKSLQEGGFGYTFYNIAYIEYAFAVGNVITSQREANSKKASTSAS